MAATFFGEIVEPASRAFFDFGEDDFDEESSLKCEFNISWKSSVPKSEVLLIFHGRIANAFARSNFVDDGKCCGTVSKQLKSIKKDVASFYNLQNNILACVISAVDDAYSVPFIDCLTQLTNEAKRIIVICSRSASQYLGDKKTEDGVLKCLVVGAKTEDLGIKCTSLEQPNFVPGVPAAFLSYSLLNNKQAFLYVCYSDDDPGIIDSRTVAPMEPILKSPVLSPLLRGDHSSKLTSGPFGNIYM